MKRKWLGSLVAMFMLVSSCSKDTTSEENNAISFSGKINNLQAIVNTGVSTGWLPSDQIGVFMLNAGTVIPYDNTVNIPYSFQGGQFGPASAGYQMFYPINDSKVDFIAYYPYVAGRTLVSSVLVDVGTQGNQANIDILYAKSTNSGDGFNKTSGTNVPLTFDHKLSKIVIRPIMGDGMVLSPEWNLMSILVEGMKTTASLDLSTGTLSSQNTIKNIMPIASVIGTNYEAIVIPQDFSTAGTLKFSFQIGTDKFVWNSPANENFESGKEYTYTIVINKTGVVLGAVTVNNWIFTTRTGIAN